MPLMTGLFVVLATLLGLAVGSFANVVAHRVPAGVSLLRESRCPACEAPVDPRHNVPVFGWLALHGRCADCDAAIPGRYAVVEAVTGIAFGGVTWYLLTAFGTAPWAQSWVTVALVVLAYLYFVAVSVALTLIDLDTRRLPNAIVLPSCIVALVLFGATAILSADGAALLRAAVGMAAMYGFYFLLRLIRPDAMGGGDVKLAGLIGLHLGWIGWGALAVGALFAFVYGALFGIALIAARRAVRRTAIPFGPWMLLGAWTGVFLGEAIGGAYLSLCSGN